MPPPAPLRPQPFRSFPLIPLALTTSHEHSESSHSVLFAIENDRGQEGWGKVLGQYKGEKSHFQPETQKRETARESIWMNLLLMLLPWVLLADALCK